MCAHKQTSGFANCGCGEQPSAVSDQLSDQPQTQTEKEAQKEAAKYANGEVPAHNKLFIATGLIVAFMLFTDHQN